MKNEVVTIRDYMNLVNETNRLPPNELSPVLYGLFGEVGSLMTAAKKYTREPDVYTDFNNVVIEEFGDVFWYFCCLANRLDIDILDAVVSQNGSELLDTEEIPVSMMYKDSRRDFDSILIKLGQLTGKLIHPEYAEKNSLIELTMFLIEFFSALYVLKLSFGRVIRCNAAKISSRFIMSDINELPTFDMNFPKFEQIPHEFEIEFVQRTDTQQAMRWNGVFIGNPLSDNIQGQDGYRFHDVFHFSFAAILHWSPTFRALIKHKRKSKPEIDRDQDGGRAIVVEEGLSAWIFAIAKENGYFEGSKDLTFDLLKNVGQFVKGYEVEQCPLILWEKAILDGYKVFREVKAKNGGVVVCSRKNRTIEYRGRINES